MKCFPFMCPVAGSRCLIVGGGEVALRKAQKLLPFAVKVEVCAKRVLPALQALGTVVAAEYAPALLAGVHFVIAATDDRELNARVANDCRAQGIMVNSVDDRQNCDFFFPALITRGEVVIGISTGGTSPALAAALRRRLEGALPQNMDEIAARAEALRGTLPAAEYERAVERLLAGEEV